MRKIGIVGSSVGENSFGAGKTYLEWITQRLDGFPIILGASNEIDPTLSLVIMPGGMDAHPDTYGETPSYYTSHTDVMKQHFATVNLPLYIEAGIPVFGICLGFQMIGIHFGCKLVQNRPDHMSDKRGEEAHKVQYLNAAKEILGTDAPNEGVNSHHHQCIMRSTFNDDELDILSVAVGKGEMKNPIIESFIHKHLPVAAVQHHPEEWLDGYTEDLIGYIIERAANQKKSAGVLGFLKKS